MTRIPSALTLLATLIGVAAVAARAADAAMGVQRVARVTFPGYEFGAPSNETPHWVQVDLGRTAPIHGVKLFPMIDWGANSRGFPVRFRIETSDDPQFHTSQRIADETRADFPDPRDWVPEFETPGITGRYVRLTTTRLRDRRLILNRLEVWSNGEEIAVGRPVTDSVRGELGRTPLTRAPRRRGEGVVTDQPENVIPADRWKPVAYRAEAPRGGVTLEPGLLRTAMENNVRYLLHASTVDEMLRQFRARAGKPSPPGLRPPDPFWDNDLAGSSAGRFLMGAGNTLRWIEDAELRRRMDALIDGIEACRRPDGYVMAFPEDTVFYSERGAYTRSWLTHGLIEAGYGGNPKALALLRGHYDWYNRSRYLPEMLRRTGQGVQGMIPSTRTYFTPVGKPEDLQVVQRYFQENDWLGALAKRDPAAVWLYPYDRAHCYLLTALEPYLDLYRATGHRRYLDAVRGGWELYRDHWQHVGGSIAICEGDPYPPQSYYLHRHTGELCGSVFWAKLGQRFHLLEPDREQYVGEIEKSIYNVGLANQAGSAGIRYHANLVGRKGGPDHKNTCCEGQGTRLLGSLPEYLYSVAADGLYVNLFAPSTIEWKQGGESLRSRMETRFPFAPEVSLRLSAAKPTRSKLRIRVPAWAAGPMAIRVNGTAAAVGKPGTFAVLERTWRDGDTLSFTLPIGFRWTRYRGVEEGPRPRYALEYGPVLMALVNPADPKQEPALPLGPAELEGKLVPKSGQPLHFGIAGDPTRGYLPYWEVQDQTFTCFPEVALPGVPARESPETDDLALASKGARVTASSELGREPGSAVEAIDGIIATASDFSNRWHSSTETPHPHWIEVRLPRPEKLRRVVLRFADPAGHPVRFEGVARVDGKERVLFVETGYQGLRRYDKKIRPVVTDTFRLVIRSSANPDFLNAAQVSEIELYR